jgi:hypothetical protein
MFSDNDYSSSSSTSVYTKIPDEFIPLCGLDGCERKVFFDEFTGDLYDYCGRTHARRHLELKRRIKVEVSEPPREEKKRHVQVLPPEEIVKRLAPLLVFLLSLDFLSQLDFILT